jgi:hypothetical protein
MRKWGVRKNIDPLKVKMKNGKLQLSSSTEADVSSSSKLFVYSMALTPFASAFDT